MSDPQSSDNQAPSLKDLESRLKAVRDRGEQARAEQRADPTGSKAAMGYAFRVGVELAAGLVVGGALGWFFDHLFGTTPLLLILFFFLGAGAGIRNVFRTAQEINKAQAAEFESARKEASRSDQRGDRSGE